MNIDNYYYYYDTKFVVEIVAIGENEKQILEGKLVNCWLKNNFAIIPYPDNFLFSRNSSSITKYESVFLNRHYIIEAQSFCIFFFFLFNRVALKKYLIFNIYIKVRKYSVGIEINSSNPLGITFHDPFE